MAIIKVALWKKQHLTPNNLTNNLTTQSETSTVIQLDKIQKILCVLWTLAVKVVTEVKCKFVHGDWP